MVPYDSFRGNTNTYNSIFIKTTNYNNVRIAMVQMNDRPIDIVINKTIDKAIDKAIDKIIDKIIDNASGNSTTDDLSCTSPGANIIIFQN